MRVLEGRWKFVILFHLFGGNVRRFVHHQVPPKVEYSLTDWGQALCPALDALLKWVDLKETLTEASLIALDKLIAPFERGARSSPVRCRRQPSIIG